MSMKKYFCLICGILPLLFGCRSAKQTTYRTSPLQFKSIDAPTLEESQARKFQYFFLEAQKCKSRDDHASAYELLQHCLNINPHSAEALSEAAVYAMRLGRTEQGVEMLKKAVRYDEDNYTYKSNLAGFYLKRQEPLKTIAVAQEMAEQFPNRLEPLLILAHLYTERNEYEQAIQALDRIEVLDGKSERLTKRKVAIYLDGGQAEKAYEEMKSLIAEYPDELSYRNELGEMYLMGDKNEEALQIFQAILKDNPDYEPTLVSMSGYYRQTGKEDLYQEYMNRLLFSPSASTTTKLQMMSDVMRQSEASGGDSTQVLAVIKKALAVPQQDANLAMLCAHYLTTKGMRTEAEPVLHKILDIDPANKPARLQLLSYALGDNDQDKIISIVTPALDYHPGAMEFYYYLGMSYFMKEDTNKAIEVFSKGVNNITAETDKKMASDLYALLGDLYHQENKMTEAFAAYDSSLVYNPDNINTLNNYAYFLSLERKQLDRAEEMSHRTVKAEPQNATYLDTYAYILFVKEKYTEARIYIEQALQYDKAPGQEVVEHAGDIFYMLGEKDKAIDYWQRALKIEDPNRVPPRPAKEVERLKRKIQQKRYIE